MKNPNPIVLIAIERIRALAITVTLIALFASPNVVRASGSGDDEDSVTAATYSMLLKAKRIMRKHGRFLKHPRWGNIWQPDQDRSWRPYTVGRWKTIKGHNWEWISDEPFGNVVYHYGRWTFDDRYGWFWVPGSQRGPAWVMWRQNADYVGWAPLPPTRSLKDFQTNRRSDTYDKAPRARQWVFVPRHSLRYGTLAQLMVPPRKAADLYYTTEPADRPSTVIARRSQPRRYENDNIEGRDDIDDNYARRNDSQRRYDDRYDNGRRLTRRRFAHSGFFLDDFYLDNDDIDDDNCINDMR